MSNQADNQETAPRQRNFVLRRWDQLRQNWDDRNALGKTGVVALGLGTLVVAAAFFDPVALSVVHLAHEHFNFIGMGPLPPYEPVTPGEMLTAAEIALPVSAVLAAGMVDMALEDNPLSVFLTEEALESQKE